MVDVEDAHGWSFLLPGEVGEAGHLRYGSAPRLPSTARPCSEDLTRGDRPKPFGRKRTTRMKNPPSIRSQVLRN